MPIKSGTNRNAAQIFALDSMISSDNIIRLIDAFCDSLDVESLGFTQKGKHIEGKPAYDVKVLLKIYLYSYINKVRSCRNIANFCKTNIELWWLTGYQYPSYKTISDFRKNNTIGMQQLFISYRDFCMELGLYGKSRIAIDGSKFKGVNSKRLNYNKKSIKRHLDHIEKKSVEYIAQLEAEEEQEKREAIEEKQKDLAIRKKKFEALEETLEESGDSQISLVDKDAKALREGINSKKIGYNIQSSVDEKNKLIITSDVTNTTDRYSLHKMSKKSKEALGLEQEDPLLVLADKGYHYGDEMAKCHADNIETLIDPFLPVNKKIGEAFQSKNFVYEKAEDVLKCPNNKSLTSNGKWYNDTGSTGNPRRYKKYTISGKICKNCPFYEQCVSESNRKKHTGRKITRAEFKDAIDRNKAYFDKNKDIYKRRQAIVEHPFGTIKRNWGYTHTHMKGIQKVAAEFSLIFLCYNIRRSVNILDIPTLIKKIKAKKTLLLTFFTEILQIGTQPRLSRIYELN